MKKFAVVLLLLSITRIGVAYADTTSANSQNYFFGTQNASENLNQVLALLVGPKGDPGPAGVAGKDGLIGMNGKDGLPGAPGATGETGTAGADGLPGASVLAVAFTGAQGTCTAGGTKFTDGAGNVTYACNGANGANGANGTNGTNGTGGGGGTLGYGQGEVSVGACEADNKIVIQPDRSFDGEGFFFSAFKLGDPTVTDGDIHDTCATKVIHIYLKMKASGLVTTNNGYGVSDTVKCTYTLPAAAGWPAARWQFTLTNSNMTCATVANATPVTLNRINTADYTDKIGFEIVDQ